MFRFTFKIIKCLSIVFSSFCITLLRLLLRQCSFLFLFARLSNLSSFPTKSFGHSTILSFFTQNHGQSLTHLSIISFSLTYAPRHKHKYPLALSTDPYTTLSLIPHSLTHTQSARPTYKHSIQPLPRFSSPINLQTPSHKHPCTNTHQIGTHTPIH